MILKILDRYSHNQWVLLGEDNKLYIRGFPKQRNKNGQKIVIGNKIGVAKYNLFGNFYQIVDKGMIKYDDENRIV